MGNPTSKRDEKRETPEGRYLGQERRKQLLSKGERTPLSNTYGGFFPQGRQQLCP